MILSGSGCPIKLSTAGPSADMSRGISVYVHAPVCPSVHVPCVHARGPVCADPELGLAPRHHHSRSVWQKYVPVGQGQQPPLRGPVTAQVLHGSP